MDGFTSILHTPKVDLSRSVDFSAGHTISDIFVSMSR